MDDIIGIVGAVKQVIDILKWNCICILIRYVGNNIISQNMLSSSTEFHFLEDCDDFGETGSTTSMFGPAFAH